MGTREFCSRPVHYSYWCFVVAPLEMCAERAFVRRGVRSYVWWVDTLPVCLHVEMFVVGIKPKGEKCIVKIGNKM